MRIADALAQTPVSSLDLSRHVTVSADTTVADTVRAMSQAKRSCACVVDRDVLVGIFTQRDVLTRVIGHRRIWDRPISEEMSRPVRTMTNDQSLADGLTVMTDWWVRSVPVVDESDQVVGNLSFWTVLNTIAHLLAAKVESTETEPGIMDGLKFVDFTGLNLHPPVTVAVDDTVDVAVHHMRNRGIGLILVVDDREHLVGIVTEFSLLLKLGCERDDLAAITIKEVMDSSPNTIHVRSSIADALATLTTHEDSHVTLLGETDRPVGVASFRDIAAYVESSIEALS